MKLAFLLFVVFASVYAGKNGDFCITPNMEKATCVPVRSCEVILSALLTRNSSALEFASKSQCGYDNGGLVCCGSSAYFASATSVSRDKGPQMPRSNMKETANKNRGDSCITPNNEHATCIAARSCKLIIDALRSRDPMAIDFAKKSQCGYDTEPLLCCGSSAYFNRLGTDSNKVDIKKLLADRSICGLTTFHKVISGVVTDIDELPWMAALEYKKKSTGASLGFKCGGSVITDRSRAWLGEWNITTDPDCHDYTANTECADPVQKINIARIIPHSDFIEATGKDDVGLLRLERAVKFSGFIRPICLPTENFPRPLRGSRLTIAGWGIKDDGRGESCITPNNEHATCIAAGSCKIIIDALIKREPVAIDFAKKSQCGYDTEPLICCGSSAYFNNSGTDSRKVDKLFPDRSICGIERGFRRILNGDMTYLDEFPWVAALEYKKKSTGAGQGIKCGGTVITHSYILTAAHCLSDRDVQVSRAWLGEWKITTDPDCEIYEADTECADPVQKINIARIIPHSGFSEATGRDDVGLLQLERVVKFTDFIRPICLPTENFPNPLRGSRLTIAGWGIKDDGKNSDVKLQAGVPLLSNAACNVKLGSRTLTANQYCAVGENASDSCKGDSGGPLMRMYQETIHTYPQWYQEGVISYGFYCGHTGYPAVYTRVSKYIDWIVNTISEDKF